MTSAPVPRGLSAFAKVLFGATFLLVLAGGLVTSTDSGLSVPDWPTTYGWNMFTFPVSKWVGGIRFEHTHRLIASTVGFLTIVLAVWVFRKDARRGVKVLAAVALAAVILQGILGGLTVRYLLPTPISVAHACLAQTFFCLTLALALLESKGWSARSPEPGADGSRRWAAAAVAAIFVQLILGAWMRHSGAGLAIPDVPTSFGRVLPDHWSSKIAIAFAHRAWAAVVAVVVFGASFAALRGTRDPFRRRPARLLQALLPLQVALGALSVITRKAVPVTVAHVGVGALLLACAVWLALVLAPAGAAAAEAAARAYPSRAVAQGRALGR